MQQEGSGTMDKKPFVNQSPAQFRNNGVSGDKKCDFVSNKSGRGRRNGSNNGGRTPEVTPFSRPTSNPKWSKSNCDKRARQRGSYDDRQREEVAESEDYNDLVLSAGSRKGNANHLLNFRFKPRENQFVTGWDKPRNATGGGRSRGSYKKLPRYNKEQFLQASCQFVVREGGEYFEQAVNPDALVNWDMIELITNFATEPVTCPICLQEPLAGKITKCGHIYCWACILHYLDLGDNRYRKCPICYDAVMIEDLKSVQTKNVPDYSVGDEIEMTLMRKKKGCVQVMPKIRWEDREGRPMKLKGGANTKFMKLLVASLEQIQKEVIDLERSALVAQLLDAEESEKSYIERAQALLDKREASLKKVFKHKTKGYQGPRIPGLALTPVPSDSSSEDEDEPRQEANASAKESDGVPVSLHESNPSKVYADAFEDEAEETETKCEGTAEREDVMTVDIASLGEEAAVADGAQAVIAIGETCPQRERNDSESSLPFGSPPSPFPIPPDEALTGIALTPDETAETLELPMFSPLPSTHQRRSQYDRPKDDYYFYQASSGQHMYLHSLNAHCLTKEYGSLEESPATIKASIASIERCFMTEEVRKRLRYLNHIPLTCEFYVMELKLAPPLVSKDTLKFFHAEFEKKRKARLRKTRDERSRAKKFEVEYKKSFGIYPEIKIPLSNPHQFPSHTASSSQDGDQVVDSPKKDVSDAMPNTPETPGSQGDSASGAMSFAQMLKAGHRSEGQTSVWARTRTVSGSSSSGSKDVGEVGSDGEDLPAPSYTASMSDAIEQALVSMEMRKQATGNQPPGTPVAGGKKKKRKEKQLLFSTAMARKN